MPKSKPRQARKGTAKPVDAKVGDKRTRAFLVSIENDGRDTQGRVLGTNGVAWRLA